MIHVTIRSDHALIYLLVGGAVTAGCLMAAFVQKDWTLAIYGIFGVALLGAALQFPDHVRDQVRRHPRILLCPIFVGIAGVYAVLAAFDAWVTLQFFNAARSGVTNQVTAWFQGASGVTAGFMAAVFGGFTGLSAYGALFAFEIATAPD